MDDNHLITILKAEEDDASSFYTSELARSQAEAMDRYHARPYGDGSEVPNRSQVVTHDIEDTINWIMPHLMRAFQMSDEMLVIDDPNMESNDPTLQDAAAYLMHIFYKDNDGETILHDFCFDGLLQKIGVVRVDWEEPQPKAPKLMEGVTVAQLLKYHQDPEYEILEISVDGNLPDDQDEDNEEFEEVMGGMSDDNRSRPQDMMTQ